MDNKKILLDPKTNEPMKSKSGESLVISNPIKREFAEGEEIKVHGVGIDDHVDADVMEDVIFGLDQDESTLEEQKSKRARLEKSLTKGRKRFTKPPRELVRAKNRKKNKSASASRRKNRRKKK